MTVSNRPLRIAAIALKKEKEEASVISKEVQQLTDTHDEVSETKQALMAQVKQLRKEVKAKREGIVWMKT